MNAALAGWLRRMTVSVCPERVPGRGARERIPNRMRYHRLLAKAANIGERVGSHLSHGEPAAYHRATARLRRSLGEFEVSKPTAHEAGRAFSPLILHPPATREFTCSVA